MDLPLKVFLSFQLNRRFDGDGVEEFYDTDDDGDGFSDSVENADQTHGINNRLRTHTLIQFPFLIIRLLKISRSEP